MSEDPATHKHIINKLCAWRHNMPRPLPVRDGGLGIRRVSSLALPAFVASAASTSLSLQDDILAGCVKSDSDFLKSCLSVWSEKFGDIPDVLPTKQPFWDRPGVLENKVSRWTSA